MRLGTISAFLIAFAALSACSDVETAPAGDPLLELEDEDAGTDASLGEGVGEGAGDDGATEVE